MTHYHSSHLPSHIQCALLFEAVEFLMCWNKMLTQHIVLPLIEPHSKQIFLDGSSKNVGILKFSAYPVHACHIQMHLECGRTKVDPFRHIGEPK